MKKKQKTLSVILFVIIQPLISFAQPSDLGTSSETRTNPDDSSVPIDYHIIILLLAGLIYSFIKFQSLYKKSI